MLLRAVETDRNININDIDRYIDKSDISKLNKIIIERLQDTLSRFSGTESPDLKKDALLPLRDAGKYYNYSQDYLRN